MHAYVRLTKSRANDRPKLLRKIFAITMVSPPSSLLDFSDNDGGGHEYEDHPGDYSARMDELFAGQSEGDDDSLTRSPRSESLEVTKATYREQLRDVLGPETTEEDDEVDGPGHLFSHGNALSDDEHLVQSTSDLQRPVSRSGPLGIHIHMLNLFLFSTPGNSRRTCRSRVIRPTILGTIHDLFTKLVLFLSPHTPKYQGLISPPNNIPPTFFSHTNYLTTRLRRYIQFTTVQRTFTRIITPLHPIKWSTESNPARHTGTA